MQILNIKAQADQAVNRDKNLDATAVGVSADAYGTGFENVLSEQQRQSNSLDTAKIATGKSSETVKSQVTDGNDGKDWHDFLQNVYEGAPTAGFGDEPVGIVGAPQETDEHWSADSIQQVLGLLEKHGVLLTEDEIAKLQALVDSPKKAGAGQLEQLLQQVSQPLSNKVMSALESFVAVPSSLAEPLQKGSQLAVLPVASKSELIEKVVGKEEPKHNGQAITDEETLRAWLVEQDLLPTDSTAAIPTEVLNAFVQGDFAPLKNWLVQQAGEPSEQVLPIDAPINVYSENAFQAWLAEQKVSPEVREAATALFEQGVRILNSVPEPKPDTIKAAFSQFVRDVKQSILLPVTPQQLVAHLEQAHQQLEAVKPSMGLQPPSENKVLQAFASMAQENRSFVQELLRNEPGQIPTKEIAIARIAEPAVNMHSLADANAQGVASVAPQTQQQAQHNLSMPRPTPAMAQPTESVFEQARQQQQYIDLFSPRAATQLKDQVAVMFNNRNQFAEMRLDPPELGRLNIRLQMNGEQQAAVTFVVHSPQAREAVEQAMPRLREMLQEQGIQLSDANVREENAHQAKERQQRAQQRGLGRDGNNEAELTMEEHEQARRTMIDVPEGRIDYYV